MSHVFCCCFVLVFVFCFFLRIPYVNSVTGIISAILPFPVQDLFYNYCSHTHVCAYNLSLLTFFSKFMCFGLTPWDCVTWVSLSQQPLIANVLHLSLIEYCKEVFFFALKSVALFTLVSPQTLAFPFSLILELGPQSLEEVILRLSHQAHCIPSAWIPHSLQEEPRFSYFMSLFQHQPFSASSSSVTPLLILKPGHLWCD